MLDTCWFALTRFAWAAFVVKIWWGEVVACEENNSRDVPATFLSCRAGFPRDGTLGTDVIGYEQLFSIAKIQHKGLTARHIN